MRPQRVLLVEDDDILRRTMQAQLKSAGCELLAASCALDALAILEREPVDLVISDIRLPGTSGLELLRDIRSEYPDTLVVMITAFGTVGTAVEAMKRGAYDYLSKPVETEDLKALVSRALERRRLVDEVLLLRASLDEKYGFENIIGHSPKLLHVLDAAARIAHTDTTVLIRGETGTGKELLAKSIHFNSPRHQAPFVVVNCGAIPAELLQSELFGHVRGSFTGAMTHKKGKVEMADRGTVFLDEIGEIPLGLQVRLLRLIQEKEIDKIGAIHPIKVDVRIIAATHRDLENMVASGAFRSDLYYRLAVVPIVLPPLRDRTEDIPEFVQTFFDRARQRHGKPGLKLPSSLISILQKHDWPGNIRELENVIEQMVVLCRSEELGIEDIPDYLRTPESHHRPSGAEPLSLEEIERRALLDALQQNGWNQSAAARQLKISRKMLRYRSTKLGLRLTRGASGP